ncbi:hypothetical protein H4R33_001094 [Dimargaris cristalligena]|uniref:Uncharacterized protein n=1 Tax=Dimargaris cristalligena TaxID=215637 RepID=A0A4P9ZY93_9FUNG|nr:hypothetical protein H4R33_001094 [Dimargaris cristalligena]RKP38338.1 hypothetical protein BJ085DRAFT_36684 [Dimargaris cristalligena]|eukprot:RKP38338.1 hypothetical protein BJ085DRAFT_36684 [Dimargaris cristalligena]
MNSAGSGPSATGHSENAWEAVREMVHKRIVTFIHLRRVVGSTQSLFFNTIIIPPEDMAAFYNNIRMRQRTHQFLTLGISLGPILDITNPNDFLKALSILMNEYHDYIAEGEKQRKKTFFRKSRTAEETLLLNASHTTGNNGLASINSNGSAPLGVANGPNHHAVSGTLSSSSPYAGHSSAGPSNSYYVFLPEGMDFNYLDVRHFPFDLDYIQTFDTLCEVICLVYNRLSDTINTLVESPALQDMITKIDGKFKKIIHLVLKELDELARQLIQDEFFTLGFCEATKTSMAIGSNSVPIWDNDV